MSNTRVVVKGKSYFVDMDGYNMAFVYVLEKAHLSGNEEMVNRTACAMLIMAIGVRDFLSIPSRDFPEVSAKIMRVLVGADKDAFD